MNVYAFLIAQILSIFSILAGLMTGAVKEKEKIYLFNGIDNTLSSIKYFLLGGYTGAISCTIAVARNIIFNRFKNKVPYLVIIIYILFAVLLQVIVVKNFVDILPIINICVYSFCLSSNNEKIMKIGGILICLISFIYDFIFKAYISVLYDCVLFIVGLCAYYIYYIKDYKTEMA